MGYLENSLQPPVEIIQELSILCTRKKEDTKHRTMHQAGSIEALTFEEQFRLHYKFLCTVACYMVADEDAAMDIVQDFFLYCWHKRDSIQITHTFKSYAVRAIRNASINYLKKTGKTKLEDTGIIEERLGDFPVTEYSEDHNRNKALWAAVEKLPEQRRKVFLLSNMDGLKYQEIADTLGISINTVKTQIKLALQFLRKECGWMIRAALVILFFKMCTGFTLF